MTQQFTYDDILRAKRDGWLDCWGDLRPNDPPSPHDILQYCAIITSHDANKTKLLFDEEMDGWSDFVYDIERDEIIDREIEEEEVAECPCPPKPAHKEEESEESFAEVARRRFDELLVSKGIICDEEESEDEDDA